MRPSSDTLIDVQLPTARLCLDCHEVHEADQCPVCASEAFAYLTRWVPIKPRRPRPRRSSSAKSDVYRRLLNAEETAKQQASANKEATPPPGGRLLKHGAVGLTAVGVLGWLWRSSERARDEQQEASNREATGTSSDAPVDTRQDKKRQKG